MSIIYKYEYCYKINTLGIKCKYSLKPCLTCFWLFYW